MIILRKLFASSQSSQGNSPDQPNEQLTSKELQLEQGRLQRQLLQTQRMKQKMQAEERKDQMNRILQLQKMEQRKDVEEDKQRVRTKKLEDSTKSENTTLYKSKPKTVAPVPMKS